METAAASSVTFDTLPDSRIQTILRAIKQTKCSVCKVRASIEEQLSQSQAHARKRQEREDYKLRVNLLRLDLEQRTLALKSLRDKLEVHQVATHQKDVSLRNRFDALHKDKSRLHEKKTGYFDVREDLIKTGAQLVMRRKQLISELALIYPISEHSSGAFKICDVNLPNSEDFNNKEENMIAAALGYTCHLVMMVSEYLDIPLRYPMEHRASKSRIRDHILDKLTDKDRDFPLYSKGKEKFQFNYGVYLLNKNIAQLRYYCGLGTTDLRLTLPNLKTLLELRLGVTYEMSNPKNVSTSMPGQHIPVPPNLGGPQKLTSGKYNTLRPRNIAIHQQTTPQDFENILNATKRENSQQDLQGSASDLSTTALGLNPNDDVLKQNNNVPSDVSVLQEDLLNIQEHARIQEFNLEQGGLLTSQYNLVDQKTVNSQVNPVSLHSARSGHPADLPITNHKTVSKMSSLGTPESIEVGSEALETPGESLPSLDSDLLQVFNSEDSLSIQSENNSNFDEPDMIIKPHGSQDSNINNSGSTFKLWSQNRKRSGQTGFALDDNSERDIDHTPSLLNLDLGDLYKSRSVDGLDDDSDEELRSLKYGAMTNSFSHNQILNPSQEFRDKYDIQQRTEALTTNFSSFKLKSARPNETVVKKKSQVRKGMLDDCLDDHSS